MNGGDEYRQRDLERKRQTERDREVHRKAGQDRDRNTERAGQKARQGEERRLAWGSPQPTLEKRLSSAFRPRSPSTSLPWATDPPRGAKEQGLVPDPAA